MGRLLARRRKESHNYPEMGGRNITPQTTLIIKTSTLPPLWRQPANLARVRVQWYQEQDRCLGVSWAENLSYSSRVYPLSPIGCWGLRAGYWNHRSGVCRAGRWKLPEESVLKTSLVPGRAGRLGSPSQSRLPGLSLPGSRVVGVWVASAVSL